MKSEYLLFKQVLETKGKTDVWYVRSKRHGERLGTIKWYGGWRQYVFYPKPDTLFNDGCLLDIKLFLTEQNKKYKGMKN